MIVHPISLFIGFVLDLLLGDPQWLPHPVRLFGWMEQKLEPLFRAKFPPHYKGQYYAGVATSVVVYFTAYLGFWAIIALAAKINIFVGIGVESVLCYQIFAMTSLRRESMKVYHAVVKQDKKEARQMVSRIVGRDTANLSLLGVVKATVETVAENTSDGVVAPILYTAIGGVPLGMLYKAINTMDSMTGYQNERYLYFGQYPARMDDLANFIPARITGVLMVAASWLTRQDAKNAWYIFKRDRKNHASPNAGHPEAAAAGALHVRLGGPAYYFGQMVQKPYIGDFDRELQPEDIRRVNRIMMVTGFLSFVLCCGPRLVGTVWQLVQLLMAR